MGRLIQKVSPKVDYTTEDGVAHTGASGVTPTEIYSYDLSGRLVGVKDANNNTTTRTLLAGSGHGSEDAEVVTEFHPDGGVLGSGYDVFGDLRKVTNELGAAEQRDYDEMGRLITVTRSNRAGNATYGIAAQTGLVEHYTYDGLGQRLTHWNSQLTSSVADKTDYDMQGRVVTTVDMGGNTVTYAYTWSGTIATTGLGTFGGWTKTTTNVTAGKTATDALDYFNRLVDHVDYGSHNYDYTFDKAGQLIGQTNSAGQDIDYTYFNTGQLAATKDLKELSPHFDSWTLAINGTTDDSVYGKYSYDADGNRLTESYNWLTVNDYTDSSTQQHVVETYTTFRYENATATYDALNRLKSFTDTGWNADHPVTMTYEYDAQGNVRRTRTVYEDVVSGTNVTQDYWYRYDSMNRFVVTKGTLSGGVIGRGATGVDITWDLAGQRKTAINGSDGTKETYYYTEDGFLSYTAISPTPTGTAVVRVRNLRDQMGRVTDYREYTTSGYTADDSTIQYSRTSIAYNTKSQVTSESGKLRQSNGSIVTSSTTNTYSGNLLTSSTTSTSGQPTTSTTNSYVWWDDARQNVVSYKPDTGQSTTYTTTYVYDHNGRLTEADIADGRPRTVFYKADMYGQIHYRSENSGYTSGGNYTWLYEYYYYLDSVRIGDIGNNGAPENDYALTISRRNFTQTNQFRYNVQTSFADFDQSYEPINGNEATTASRYVVKAGDTLQSIARSVWGDESLWWLIADANGMDGSEELQAGVSLSIPAKVANVHNTTDTFKVYDPNMAMGNTFPGTPAAPKPKKHHWYDFIIKAIDMIVSVVASYFLGPILGNMAFQGFMMLTGQQDKFSWNQVGMAALTAFVTAGVNASGIFNGIKNAALNAAATAATSSAISQGIGVATGMQKEFSWTSVAVAGVSAGVTKAVSDHLPGADPMSKVTSDANARVYTDISGARFGNQLASNLAGGVASAATMSLMDGTDFGDNLMQTLPGAIGMTLGNRIAGQMQKEWEKSGLDDTALGKVVHAVGTVRDTLDGAVMGAGAWVGHEVGPYVKPVVDEAVKLGSEAFHDIAVAGRTVGHDIAQAGRELERLGAGAAHGVERLIGGHTPLDGDSEGELDKPTGRGSTSGSVAGREHALHIATAADLAIPRTPGSAPLVITFSDAIQKSFDVLMGKSYPGGHSQEQGEDVVFGKDGTLGVQNAGGSGSSSGSFHPNLVLSDPGKFSVAGVFHTHPYDKSEGSFTNISLSGGDAGYLVDKPVNFIIAQSGDGEFMYLKTSKTPSYVDANALNNKQNVRIGELEGAGYSFAKASSIAAAETAKAYGLAYYEGSHGTFKRIYP